MQAANGKIYGMTNSGGTNSYGTVFSLTLNGIISKVADLDYYVTGANPLSSSFVQGSDGKLYAVLDAGGDNSAGTLISLNITTNTITKLFDFEYGNGNNLEAGTLVEVGTGKFYGNTRERGLTARGTIFSFQTGSNTNNKVYDFVNIDGFGLNNKITRSSNGLFYGMFTSGGMKDSGTVFSFDPANNIFTKHHDLGNFGGHPKYTGFVESATGLLYSTSSDGGVNGGGTIISYDPTLDVLSKLADFNGATTGSLPRGELIYNNGKYYGICNSGGTNGFGTLYSFDPLTNVITTLYNFKLSDGNPSSTLIFSSNNRIYGITSGGNYESSTTRYNVAGRSGGGGGVVIIPYTGAIFSFDPSTTEFNKLFSVSTDASFGNNLIETNRKIYCTVSAEGGNHGGVLYSIDVFSNIVSEVHVFEPIDGIYPSNYLTLSSTGLLYGMSISGGSYGYGTLFSLDPTTNTFTKLQDFDGNNGGYPISQALIETSTLTVTLLADVYATPSDPAGIQPNTIYVGYGPASTISIEAFPDGGGTSANSRIANFSATDVYTYEWTIPNHNLTIIGSTTNKAALISSAITYSSLPYIIKVKVTDSKGEFIIKQKVLQVIDVRCGKKLDKVSVCQIPSKNSNVMTTVCVSPNAVAAVLHNGGYLGSCKSSVTVSRKMESNTNTLELNKEVVIEINDKNFNVKGLSVTATPNPHHGMFNLIINSPESAQADIKLFSANGQLITARVTAVRKGQTSISFTNIKQSLLFYKVRIGNNYVTGKVVGPN